MEGLLLGFADGLSTGELLGEMVGEAVGFVLGDRLGSGEGSIVGEALGSVLGFNVGEALMGASVGEAMGSNKLGASVLEFRLNTGSGDMLINRLLRVLTRRLRLLGRRFCNPLFWRP